MLRIRLEAVLSDPPTPLLPLLVLLSVLYRGLTSLHRRLYSSGVLSSRRLPRPVVSVGNLVVGGGGKTPLTMWVAERLIASGINVAILSRGYGRTRSDLRIVQPEDSWELVGDEPVLMASKIKGAKIVVSKDRFAAGTKVLENSEVDLFLLDDGYQHYPLKRDMDIVVIDGQSRFGNGRLLPAGILREPVSRLRDADLIVVTRAQCADPEFESYLKRHTTAPVFWADYSPAGLSMIGPAEFSPWEGEPGGNFVAFSGIAGPEGFHDSLSRAGIEVVSMLVFPDHHPYSVSDIDMIMKTAASRKAIALVTTEKDAVRWPRRKMPLPVYSLAVQPVIEREKELMKEILNLVRKERRIT